MKIAVAGATSFISLKLIESLLKNRNNNIVSVVRRESKSFKNLQRKTDRIQTVQLNLKQYDQLGPIIGRMDCLVYLMTWNVTRGASRLNQKLQKSNYYNGIKAICSVLETGCNKILTAGSQAEYGPWFSNEKMTEQTPANPNTKYRKFKLQFFKGAKKLAEEKNVQLIEPRFFSLYGPHDYSGTMVISMLHNMLENKPCDLTECIQTWDFLHIDDAVRGLAKLIQEDVLAGVYNFGSGESHSLKWYVEKMAEVTRSKSKLHYGAVPYLAIGMVNVNLDVSKLASIGWKPEITFKEGIKKILQPFEIGYRLTY